MEVPLVYFFGHATPADHSELYKLLVERLADLLDRRAKSSPEVGGNIFFMPAKTCPAVREATNRTLTENHPTGTRFLLSQAANFPSISIYSVEPNGTH